MSVCIAAICNAQNSSETRIFAIADMRMSTGESSNDTAAVKGAVKGLCLPCDWLALYAGNNVAPVVPIVNRACEIIRSHGENKVEHFMEAFRSSYQEHLAQLVESKVLSRWRLTTKEFFERGREKFGDDVFDSMCAAIEQLKLECSLMVAGVDEEGMGHIFTVRNPGIVESRDVPGFWAIGNGDYAALSMLGFFGQNDMFNLAHTMYHLAAKFMAESATDVGRKTWSWILSPYGFDLPDLNLEDELRKYWGSHFKRHMPPKAHGPILAQVTEAEKRFTRDRNKIVETLKHEKKSRKKSTAA
jgi:hypothetical protein